MRGRFAILDLHGRKVATTLVGSVPGGHGGPWALADGRLVARDDEAVVDEGLADRHDRDVGDRIDIEIVLVPGQVARIGVAALVVAAFGAVIPLRRVLGVDPASAFRRSA